MKANTFKSLCRSYFFAYKFGFCITCCYTLFCPYKHIFGIKLHGLFASWLTWLLIFPGIQKQKLLLKSYHRYMRSFMSYFVIVFTLSLWLITIDISIYRLLFNVLTEVYNRIKSLLTYIKWCIKVYNYYKQDHSSFPFFCRDICSVHFPWTPLVKTLGLEGLGRWHSSFNLSPREHSLN